ncbi:hypothetical protein MNBD_GAMMA11-3492, partial [hydrothermal vent metagenome]
MLKQTAKTAEKKASENISGNRISNNISGITPIPVGQQSVFIQRKPLCACGGNCPTCKSEPTLQPALKTGPENDRYEQEANKVAEQIMRIPQHTLQRQTKNEAEEKSLQEKPLISRISPLIQSPSEPEKNSEYSAVQTRSLQTGGHTMPHAVRAFYEPKFGQNFNHVRLHTDTEAAHLAKSVNARAFTAGSSI